MAKKTGLGLLVAILLIIGGLNWGLAIWNVNLVTMLFASVGSWLVNTVYALVGLAALYKIYMLVK